MIVATLWMASAFFIVIAFLCFKLARAKKYLSILNQCISDMLQQPRAAEAIAAATRQHLIDEGLVDE